MDNITIRETSLNVWYDVVDSRTKEAFDKTIQLLRSRGWKIGRDTEFKEYANCRAGSKADLSVALSYSGRHVEVRFWQRERNEPGRKNSPRWAFGQLGLMTKMQRYKVELECKKITELVGLPVVNRNLEKTLKGDAWIDDFMKGNRHTCDERSRQGGDHSRLEDGQQVYILVNQRPMRGILRYNINNMWWVKLPDGTVRNKASFEIYQTLIWANPRKRWFRPADRYSRIKDLKSDAVAAENFERAIVLRDILKQLS